MKVGGLYVTPLLFPLRFSSLLAYKIPRDDVGTLSHAFFLLEEGTAASL